MFLYEIEFKKTFIKTTKVMFLFKTKSCTDKGFSFILVCGGFCLILGVFCIYYCSYII